MAVWRLWILCGVALLATEHGSGLIIGGCEQGNVDVVEDSNRSFTYGACRNNRVQIRAYNDGMETIFFCSCIKHLCTDWNDKFNLFELYYYPGNNTCRLQVSGITRNSARTLSFRNSLTNARCEFRIIVAPVYSHGDCSVSISNWMVIGSCTVTGMFSSDNNYTCKWRENENNEEFGGFGTTLRNYTAVNSRTYTQGVCSFAKSIPTTKGHYNYSVSVSPGADDYFNEEVYIESQQTRPNAGLIGGVIAAVLVVLIIVGVLIVYIIKRRKDPVYDTTRRPENNEHNYVDLALSGRDSLPTAGPDDDKAKRENNNEHRYEEVTIAGQNVSEQPELVIPD